MTRSFNLGDTIIQQGEPALEAFLIEDGTAEVFMERDGKPVILATLGPGEIFGERALFKGSDYGASVRAMTPLTALPITPPVLDAKIKSCDPMIRALIRMLMVRLAQANEKIS
jgi:CRP-like cAMP-binding protein